MGFLFAVLYFWLAQPTWKSLALGMIFIVPGLLTRAMASGHVRKNEALAMSGPYAYTRNPLYFGSLLVAAGFAVAGRSWLVVVALLLMLIAIYLPVIRDEEAFLRSRFSEFEEYSRRVPRMLPRLGRRWSAENCEPTEFSFDLYMKHREYNALLGSVAITIGLLVKMFLFRARG